MTITEKLIQNEVKYLLSEKRSIEWVKENYTPQYCEAMICDTLQGQIAGCEVHAFILDDIFQHYCDEFLDFHQIAEEVVSLFIREKKKDIELLRHMKNYCAIIDIANEVGTPHQVNDFYDNISFRKLLNIYSQYNGLSDYKEEEPEDYQKSYSVDMLTILEILNQEHGESLQ